MSLGSELNYPPSRSPAVYILIYVTGSVAVWRLAALVTHRTVTVRLDSVPVR